MVQHVSAIVVSMLSWHATREIGFSGVAQEALPMLLFHLSVTVSICPIGSMYGIYANIWGILMVNVTIYGSTMDPMGVTKTCCSPACFCFFHPVGLGANGVRPLTSTRELIGNSNNLTFNTEYLNEAMEPTSRIIQEAWRVARLRNSKDATWLIACILLDWLCVHPLVNKHNYGKSQCYPFLMGKSTISILWPFSIENC